MALVLTALAFIPQVTLARITGSTKKCSICGLPYGVRGLQGVALPCGHEFGECKCCTSKTGPTSPGSKESKRCHLGNLSSGDIKCPLCSTSAVGLQQPNYTAVAALYAAEAQLSRERKQELRKRIEETLVGPKSVGQSDSKQDLEFDFNELFE